MTSHAVHLIVPVTTRDHMLGPSSAPVTLVEYGDFECPHCGRAYPIVKELRRHLGDRLRVIFRHFPLREVHPHAEHAAQAAEAAAAQGTFWQMHDMLFEHQDALDDADLREYARRLGLDTRRFTDELTTGVYRDRVQDDVRGGIQSGVHGTPTFFVNGLRHDGPWELSDLLEAIGQAGATGADAAPSIQGTDRQIGSRPAADVAADPVTLASWESFPASDAPGWRGRAA